MSFSSKVKEELSLSGVRARHCQIAELTAIVTMCGGISISARDRITVKIQTENRYVVRRYTMLLGRVLQISAEVSVRVRKNVRTYLAVITAHEDALRLLQVTHLLQGDMDVAENMSIADNLILQKSCCKRAFLRGAFLSSGSVSDPMSSYHLEIVAAALAKARQLQAMMESFDLDAKIVERKGHFVVYLKEGAQIVDMLGVMEASRALLELENIRILKEIGNSVNRKVNCETANLHKTVTAALDQIRDIEYLQETGELDYLSEGLRTTAYLRLENPDASLIQLGQLHTPPVGKSGVNHRLKKLSQLAKEMRES